MPAEEKSAGFGRAAGRFVRAAGVAGRAAVRELERPTAESPPAAPAPPPAAPPPAAETRRRRARRPDPEPNRFLDSATHTLWWLTFDSAAFMVIQADLFIPEGTARTVVQALLAALFLLDGFLLVTDSWQMRRRLVLRLARGKGNKDGKPDGKPVGWRRWAARLGQELFPLFGILWIGLGLWVASRALFGGTL